MLTHIRTAGVVGAGLMGRGIAGVLADAGVDVRIVDAQADTLAAAVDSLFGRNGTVAAAGSLAEVIDGADLVLEAVSERIELKQQIFAELSELADDTILATNTSVLPVTRIAERAKHPARVVGTHWWNPPQLIPIVEVVRGAQTSEETMVWTFDALSELGKTPVRVERDVPGFIGNRLQHALWREAISLVAEGICDAPTVDLVVRNTIGLRLAQMGPIENADYIGLDLTRDIHDVILSSLNRDQAPSPLLRDLVDAGQLGAKSGQGFLSWEPGARDHAATQLAQHVARQLDERQHRQSTAADSEEK